MKKFEEGQKGSEFFKFIVIMKKFHILTSSFHSLPLNVSHTDFHTMSYIVKSAEENPNGASMGDLARELQISPPAVSRAISSLENRGYVKRTTDINNRRSVTVTPTQKGLIAMEEDRRFFEKIAKKITCEMGIEKLNELETLLKQLYQTVNDTIKEELSRL